MARKVTLLSLFFTLIIIAGCGGGGSDPVTQFIVGNISGPSYILEGQTATFTISASGDTGIFFEWAVQPSGVGSFNDKYSSSPRFLAGKVPEDTPIMIFVTVNSDNHSPIVNSHSVTITDSVMSGWVKAFGGFGWDAGFDTAVDPSGNVYVAGVFMETVEFDANAGVVRSSHGGYDAYLAKYTADGDIQWAKTWGGTLWDQTYAVTLDGIGNLYVAGWFQGTSDFDPSENNDFHTAIGDLDCFITKFTVNGDHLWTKTWGGQLWDKAQDVAVDIFGDVIITGFIAGTVDLNPNLGVDNHTTATNWDGFAIKLNPSGDYLWGINWDSEEAHAVDTDSSGNIYIAGYYYGNAEQKADFDPDPTLVNYLYPNGIHENACLSKFTPNGEYTWAMGWGGVFEGDSARMVTVDEYDNVYVTGCYRGLADLDPTASEDWHESHSFETIPTQDIFLSKFNTAGSFLWSRTFGGNGVDTSDRMIIDQGGNVMICGRYFQTVDFDASDGITLLNSVGGQDMYVTEYNSSGNYRWCLGIGGEEDEAAWGVAETPNGDIVLAGLFHATVDFNPDIGINNRTANGEADAFVLRLTVE